jgi:Flp pilus assembly pilin Flp
MKQFLLFISLLPLCLFSQTQIGQDIDGESVNDRSGSSVSLSSDGSIVAIGAPYNAGNGVNSGHVRVYENISGVWTQIGADINGEATGDSSGVSVSLSSDGSIVAIGAPYNAGNGVNSGHVRVYENISGVWTQIGNDINGEAPGDYFGWTVSLSSNGSILAVGAIFNTGINGAASGHVRVYENISGTWTQIGVDIDGEAVADRSGTSLSLSSDGSTVAIGTPYNAGNGSNSGHVRVYKNISGTWTQIGSDINGEAAGDRSGIVSLSSDGSILAVGAASNDGNGDSSGHVRVFENISGTWTQIGNDINGEAAYDLSGGTVSLSLDGSIVAIGAIYNTGITGTYSGHVRIYKNISSVWTQIGSDIDGEATNNFSGAGLALSPDSSVVAIGAIFNSDNGIDSGHVRVYDLTSLLSLEDNVVSKNFTVYPNPVKEQLHLQLSNSLEFKNVKIYNGFGQNILESIKTTINLSSLSTGIYFVLIETNQGKAVKKIIKE